MTSFSVELMPRTTRAQSMDALSSMATACRLQSRAHRRGHAAAHLPHAHHRCWNHYSRARADHWSRRGRAASHRDSKAPGRGRLRLRRAACGQGAGAKPRRALCRASAGSERCAGRRRLCQGAGRSFLSAAARVAGQGHRRERRGHNHRRRARQESSGAGHEGDGQRAWRQAR